MRSHPRNIGSVYKISVDHHEITAGIYGIDDGIDGEVRPDELEAADDSAADDQGQADQDGVLHGGLVDHWQHARQTQVNRGDVGVRVVAKSVRRVGEHLGLGVQLNVDLEAQNRIVAIQCFVEVDQFIGVVAHDL